MFPLDLLTPPRKSARVAVRDPMDTARLIGESCRLRGVQGYVRGIQFGPLVTTFAFEPAIGRPDRKVESLAADLRSAIRTEFVLIERIPGSSLFGIQVPNARRQRIALREVLESDAYQQSLSPLTIALGQTATGESYVRDLMTMPHLLIAGPKDAGQAAGLMAILTSILHRAEPDDVRLVLIDTADTGLKVFEGIPHLRAPVVTEARQAANTLRWAVREMERRFRLLAAAGVRNLVQYNRSIRQASADDSPAGGSTAGLLPVIVVVVAELAQPMLAAPVDVEEAIVCLAQMSRAVGIHLVVATEHFSVGILTGLMKINLPARISYRVQTAVESRAILDRSGAECLLGGGDMLFLPPSSCDCVRLHGSLVTMRELARVASYLRRQSSVQHESSISEEDDSPSRVWEPEADPLLGAAARLVRATGQLSISYLQRRLGIGFSRAGRLLDRIRADGLG